MKFQLPFRKKKKTVWRKEIRIKQFVFHLVGVSKNEFTSNAKLFDTKFTAANVTVQLSMYVQNNSLFSGFHLCVDDTLRELQTRE